MLRIYFSFIAFLISTLSTEVLDYSVWDSTVPIYLSGLVMAFGFNPYNAYNDAKRIRQGKKINHFRSVIERWWIVLIPFVSGAWKAGLTIEMLGVLAPWIWITFDLLLNKYRGLPLNYISNWEGTALLDRVFDDWVEQYTAKAILFGIATYIFFT